MARARIVEMVRRFKDNSLKMLLEDPGNVRDLLRIAGTKTLDRIDFAGLQVERTTFVLRDYRHVEADLVLTAPLRSTPGEPARRRVIIYILIEHQSEPDPLMLLRLLDYITQVFRRQLRLWQKRHRTLRKFLLDPVLPVVFYTGTRTWDSLGELSDLMNEGKLFAEFIPTLAPLFVNLSVLSGQKLEQGGGYFGWVLRLLQQRHARPAEFQALLPRVVQHLETMPGQDRLRWLDLLSFIHAVIYHERRPAEHAG
jgi:Putative transposase, YhgA-like